MLGRENFRLTHGVDGPPPEQRVPLGPNIRPEGDEVRLGDQNIDETVFGGGVDGGGRYRGGFQRCEHGNQRCLEITRTLDNEHRSRGTRGRGAGSSIAYGVGARCCPFDGNRDPPACLKSKPG